MKYYFRTVFFLPSTKVLILLSVFSLALSFLRGSFAESSFFFFMIWNLFLAWIPWFISSVFYIVPLRSKLVEVILFVIWLLFFPNAHYMITDLLHVEFPGAVPNWYDLTLLFSYACTGLLYAFVSLNFVEVRIMGIPRPKITPRDPSSFRGLVYPTPVRRLIMRLVISFIIYLSCFGIYLGRFLRWNSWDIIMDFQSVFQDSLERILMPFEHGETWAFTFIFGTMINVLYFCFTKLLLFVPTQSRQFEEVPV